VWSEEFDGGYLRVGFWVLGFHYFSVSCILVVCLDTAVGVSGRVLEAFMLVWTFVKQELSWLDMREEIR
jgi:hypothetical protein